MSTVYVVMGAMYYEGCEADTVRVFLSREAAVAYGESLTAEQGDWRDTRWDRYQIVETVVA